MIGPVEKKSNYEIIRETWRAKFLEMDHESLARRFNLEIDPDFLSLTYFSRRYSIHRKTARIVRLDNPDHVIGFDQELTFFNMFHYAVEFPHPSGELVPFRSVKRVYPFEAAYKKTILEPFQLRFTGHADRLQSALNALGAQPFGHADAGGKLEVFPGLCLAVIFWDADDEFPAQANMLFDSNITDYMHEENVVMVASDAAALLAEESGLPVPDALPGSNI